MADYWFNEYEIEAGTTVIIKTTGKKRQRLLLFPDDEGVFNMRMLSEREYKERKKKRNNELRNG